MSDANTIWVRAYNADGFECSLTLEISSAANAAERLNELKAAGFLPRKPDAPQGEVEAVSVVVRRASAKGTPIIDFYPAWQYEGTFGAHKYAHKYLNNEQDIAQFEAQSGLKLEALPLYEGQAPLTRRYGSATRFEVAVTRKFEMRRISNGQSDNGMPKYEYSYAHPLTLSAAQAPAPSTAPTPNGHPERIATKEDADKFYHVCQQRYGVSADEVKKLLNVPGLSLWEGTWDEALNAVEQAKAVAQ